jgi:hypothetical protein
MSDSLKIAWEIACCEFLAACFHGAPPEVIKRLGDDVHKAIGEFVRETGRRP